MPLREKVVRNVREVARAARSGPGERRAVRRRWTFDALRAAVPVVGVETQDGWLLVPTADRTVGRSVYVHGGWEADVLPRAVRLAEQLTGVSPRGRVVVEVGANIGTTTVAAARLASRVVALEPSPDNLRLLRANVAINDLRHVDVVPCAASDEQGTAELGLSDVNWGDNRLGPSTGRSVAVPLRRLDDVLDDLAVRPDQVGLLWSDTQGHEAQVLRGAPRLLAAGPAAVVEYWPQVLAEHGGAPALHDLVAEHYDTVVDLSADRGPEPLARIAERHREGLTDLLLLRRS